MKSYSEINTTLKKHPTIFKRIKEQLIINKKQSEIEKNNKKEPELLVKAEKNTNFKKQKETKEVSKVEITTEPIKPESEIQKELVKKYVIDASITGIQSLRDTISKICAANSKIILTSITIKELEKMQKFSDFQGIDARYILALAAENFSHFETVLIDETFDTPDDCIIHYCAENKNYVTLLTSDKTMVLKARMYGVQVKYLKHNQTPKGKSFTKNSNSKIKTLTPAKRVANKLLISIFYTNTMSLCVSSNGIVYTDGIRELRIGDDVFIATKKVNYITFAHYKIVSLYSENNCELIYSKRFYNYNYIDVPKESYESFIENFKKTHNL